MKNGQLAIFINSYTAAGKFMCVIIYPSKWMMRR